MKKNEATKIKNVEILNFELFPNIPNNLDLYENFTTITKLQGDYNPINFIQSRHWMKEIQVPDFTMTLLVPQSA